MSVKQNIVTLVKGMDMKTATALNLLLGAMVSGAAVSDISDLEPSRTARRPGRPAKPVEEVAKPVGRRPGRPAKPVEEVAKAPRKPRAPKVEGFEGAITIDDLEAFPDEYEGEVSDLGIRELGPILDEYGVDRKAEMFLFDNDGNALTSPQKREEMAFFVVMMQTLEAKLLASDPMEVVALGSDIFGEGDKAFDALADVIEDENATDAQVRKAMKALVRDILIDFNTGDAEEEPHAEPVRAPRRTQSAAPVGRKPRAVVEEEPAPRRRRAAPIADAEDLEDLSDIEDI